jgi:hypothetical protein
MLEARNQDSGGYPMVGIVGTKDGRMTTEVLGVPTVARQLPVTDTSDSVALTATCRRISIKARFCDMRFVVGTGAQTANAATSHFIEAGERLDFAVPAGATIAAIRETAATVNGTLEIAELS